MKKLVCCLLVLSLTIVSFASCTRTDTAQIDAENFLTRLENGGFLPLESLAEFPYFREIEDSNGNAVMVWQRLDEKGNAIHKLEVTVAETILVRYSYIAYEMIDMPLNDKLALEEGEELAMRFIGAFRPDLAGLTWENGEWYLSRYEPGVVEAWVADDGVFRYGILVDLNLGGIIHFSVESV